MNHQFDELAKGLAQSVTRRQALKRFGLGLAGLALACFGLVERSRAGQSTCCTSNADCKNGETCNAYGFCAPKWCATSGGICCCYCKGKGQVGTACPPCNPNYGYCVSICGGYPLGGC